MSDVSDLSRSFERDGYEYELIDRERGSWRVFDFHDPEWFERRYLVVVHEHCEHPRGDTACDHYESSPIRDGYAGVMALNRRLDRRAGLLRVALSRLTPHGQASRNLAPHVQI